MTGCVCLLFPEMEQKAGKSSEDGATVPPAAEAPEPAGGGGSVEEEATGPAESTARAGPATAGQQEQAPAEDGVSAECHADGLGEVKLGFFSFQRPPTSLGMWSPSCIFKSSTATSLGLICHHIIL